MSSFALESFQTAGGRSVVLRSCSGFEELEACVQLQIDTWGYGDMDVIPRRMFLVAQRVGGQVIGAFDVTGESKLIGFAMAIPGLRKTPELTPYLHSHMLAVSPEYRNAAIGRRLKLYQRREALSRGIVCMEWTFDPLEIKNSFLNIHKLGAVVRGYSPDFYGVSSSRLQSGLPTDRLHAEWFLDSQRIEAILKGEAVHCGKVEEAIVVPQAIVEWKQSDVPRALALQMENRARFQSAFARGLAVTGFERDAQGNGIFQLTKFSL